MNYERNESQRTRVRLEISFIFSSYLTNYRCVGYGHLTRISLIQGKNNGDVTSVNSLYLYHTDLHWRQKISHLRHFEI